jgi:uncharacterized membrane protein
MGNGMIDGLGWAAMGFHWLWMLVPVAGVVGAAWLLAMAVAGGVRRRTGDEAEALLRRRLATGEIDTGQYEQARAALGLGDRP